MLSRFNPYDLNNVADLDLYIKEDEKRKLLELSRTSELTQPVRGILKPLTVTELADISARKLVK